MFRYVDTHRWIESLIWFELHKQADWRVGTSEEARRAFADGAARLEGRRRMADIDSLPKLAPTPFP